MRCALGLAGMTLCLALVASLSGCAAMSAKSAFKRGETARAKGDFDEAIKNYEQAASTDPKKPEYKSAADNARKEAIDARAQRAREAEDRGDFAAATKMWDEALHFSPSSAELAARKQLAVLKTKQADPVEFYEAAKKLAAALPGDAGAAKALTDAKQSAVAYHLRLADTYAEAKANDRAHAEYEIAKKIDPENAVFKGATYRGSEAKFLESLADEKMKAGDSLSAYDLYKKAAEIKTDPGLERKMKRAEQGAGPIVEQLEQAKQFAERKLWEDAAEIYSVIVNRTGVPADVAPRAAEARKQSAKLRADRAKAFGEKGLVGKAAAELTLALEHTDAPKETLSLLEGAVEALSSSSPGDAKAKIDRARESAPDLAIVQVAPMILDAVAQTAFEDAKKLAEKSAADGLLALRKLEPFADRLRGFGEAKEKLVKKAFGALIDNAEKRSAEGRFDNAAELLQTALEISKAPKDIADYLKAGTAGLTKKEWSIARDNFDKALAVSAKSNLARVGRKVAVTARLTELRHEAKEARAAEDSLRAATAYRAILEIDPNDADAKAGSNELRAALVDGALRSAQESEAAGKTGAAFIYYKRVIDLDPNNPEAKAAVNALAQSMNISSDPEGYVAPTIRGDHLGSACPDVEKSLRERVALYLNKTRKLGAEFVPHEVETAVDEKKRPAPPVVLRSAVEGCDLQSANGSMTLTVQMLFAGGPIAEERVTVKLDPSGIPKDELAEGLNPKRVEKLLLGEAAKAVTNAIKPHAAKLADWRSMNASAAMKANDAEAAARAYAVLSTAKDLSEKERRTLGDLERFLMNKYR